MNSTFATERIWLKIGFTHQLPILLISEKDGKLVSPIKTFCLAVVAKVVASNK